MLEKFFKKNPIILKYFSRSLRAIVNILDNLLPTYKSALVVSYAGKRIDGSPLIIADLCIPSDYSVIIAVRKNVKQCEHHQYIKYASFKYFWVLITSKIWISNVNIELGFSLKRSSQIYINSWHGIPFVTIGNCVSNRSDYDFSRVDLLTTCSLYDEQVFSKCFNANKSSFIRSGLPRNINLTGFNFQKSRNELSIDQSKIVFLYAPTWRIDKKKCNDIYRNFIDYWGKNITNKRFLLLCKFHHLSEFEFSEKTSNNIIIEKGHNNLNLCMQVANFLITDYSSIYFDFSILKKPTIFYMPDIKSYSKERGFYMSPNDKHGKVVKSLNNLKRVVYDYKKIKYSDQESFHDYDLNKTIQKIKSRINKIL